MRINFFEDMPRKPLGVEGRQWHIAPIAIRLTQTGRNDPQAERGKGEARAAKRSPGVSCAFPEIVGAGPHGDEPGGRFSAPWTGLPAFPDVFRRPAILQAASGPLKRSRQKNKTRRVRGTGRGGGAGR